MPENANAERRKSADYTARTVQEALQRAAADLGVAMDQLDYTVIRDNTHTILGLVRTGEVTIRVWAKQPEPRHIPPTPEPTQAPEAQAAEQEAEPEKVREPVAPPTEDRELDEEEEEWEERDAAAAPATRSTEQSLAELATDVVSHLIDGMGLYAAVEVMDPGGEVDPRTNEVSPLQINVIGDDLGILIGRRGETLRDLQFITRLIISRKTGKWPNVVVDVEGYKARRAEALRALAKRMADRVRSTGQAVVLEPMPAYERRIVHLALRDDEDVYTESTGEGESRKVQILPK